MPCACASCTIYPDGRTLLEAFAQVEPGQFDAILMDVQMPAINGLDAMREIRRGKNPLGRTIPIIAMTANAFSSDKQACLDAGTNAHVVPHETSAATAKPARNQLATRQNPLQHARHANPPQAKRPIKPP